MRRLLLLALVLSACGDDGRTSDIAGQLACTDCVTAEDGSYHVDFGNVLLGDIIERGVTLENRGSAPLTVDFPSLPPPFSCASCGRLQLAPGKSARLSLGFAPTATGPAAAQLSVRGNGRAPVTFRLGGLGAQATFTCEPQRVDFGGWKVGVRSEPQIVSCINTADVSLRLVVQAARSPFATQPEPEVVTVDPGRILQIPVTFQAEEPGLALGHMELKSEGRLNVAQVSLAGTGLERLAAVEPALTDFGHVTLGTSRTLPVTVRNVGAASLQVTEVWLEEDQGPFSFSPSAPFELAPAGEPGDRVDVAVTFTPPSIETRQGELHVLTADTRTPLDVGLRGTGGGPTISCAPGERAFGVTAIGSPRTLSFLCTNVGFDHPDTLADGLLITGATTTSARFTASARAHDFLGVGQGVAVDVTYAPDAEGVHGATVQIASNDSATPVLSLPVAGEGGTFEVCSFELAPQALEFGRVPAGQEVRLAVAVRNQGTTNCLAGDARILPGGSDAFRVDDAPARVLAPGEQLLVPVIFAPGTAGQHQAELGLHVNGAPEQRVALRGSSAEACLILRPAPLDFGIVAPGCATQVRYLELENRCGAPITVDSVDMAVSAGAPFRVEPTELPWTILTGDFHEVGLVYHPAPDVVTDHFGAALVQLRGETEPWAVALRGRAEGDPVQEEVFVQHERPTVDVLFVVDGQPGMEDVHDRLASPGVREAFLGYAREQEIDFHLGVTNTSVGVNAACVGDGRLLPLSGTRFLTPEVDVDALWPALLSPGICSFGKAQGMEAALRAVTPPVVNGRDDPRHPEPDDGNEGFLRRKAHLALVFVSIDDDHSPDLVDSYLAAFRATKAARSGNLFSVHAVIHPPGAICAGTIAEGVRTADLVKKTFGEVASVCSADWASNLDRVGRAAFGYTQCFELTNVPEGSGDPDGWFTLLVGGKPYPAIGSRGERRWEYRADQNAICFRPLSVPEPGIEIEVDYGVACLP